MKNSKVFTTLLLGGCLMLSTTLSAQDRVVKMTTDKAIGTNITLQVNNLVDAISIDWGDGKPVSYTSKEGEIVTSIQGTVKGSTISISGKSDWFMLNCSNCGLTDIDLNQARQLQSLYCQNNNLKAIDIKGMTMLTDLNCSHNQIKGFEFTDKNNPDKDLSKIENLDFSYNQFSGIYLIRLKTLQNLKANNNEISSFYVYDPEIKTVDCSNNKIKNLLVLSDSPKLSTLNCCNNNIMAVRFANDGEYMQQLVCDNNRIRSINILNAVNLTDISCSNNGAKELFISGKAKNISSYNVKNNALSLKSLPGRGYEPEYMDFLPQNPFDITKSPGFLMKDNIPYAPVILNWSDRTETFIDLKDHCALANNRLDANVAWFSINTDGSETEMIQRTSSTGTGDFYGSYGKFAFFTPEKRAYVQLTSRNYGFVLKSLPIAIGDDVTAVENVISDENGLQIGVQHGAILMGSVAPTHAKIFTIDGKNVWEGTVDGTATVKLPKGVYVVNGKKVML